MAKYQQLAANIIALSANSHHTSREERDRSLLPPFINVCVCAPPKYIIVTINEGDWLTQAEDLRTHAFLKRISLSHHLGIAAGSHAWTGAYFCNLFPSRFMEILTESPSESISFEWQCLLSVSW